MLELLSMLLGSSALGTLIGGVFAYLNRKSDIEAKKVEREQAKDKFEYDIKLRDKDIEQVKAEAQGRREVAVVEGEASVESARLAAIAASYKADELNPDALKEAGWWKWLLVLGAAFRTWIRPLATVALTSMALYISWFLLERLLAPGTWEAIPAKERLALAYAALNWVFAQAGSALGYWFVSRGGGKDTALQQR